LIFPSSLAVLFPPLALADHAGMKEEGRKECRQCNIINQIIAFLVVDTNGRRFAVSG